MHPRLVDVVDVKALVQCQGFYLDCDCGRVSIALSGLCYVGCCHIMSYKQNLAFALSSEKLISISFSPGFPTGAFLWTFLRCVIADPDPIIGLIWWNRLTESERRHWLDQAGSARPVDAWRAYQRGLPGQNGLKTAH